MKAFLDEFQTKIVQPYDPHSFSCSNKGSIPQFDKQENVFMASKYYIR